MMEKTISIGGKEVRVKCPASFPLRYSNATSRDFFADLAKLGEVDKTMKNFNSRVMYDIVYVMAKCADKTIPNSCADWIDTFDDFSLFDVFQEIQPLLIDTMKMRKN